MSPRGKDNVFPYVRFPRVSGDEPGAVAHLAWYGWFSPRERG